ncbi:DUF1641 domain-containing protein [Brevibacillus fulvus]|uniref:Uncharacterized protein YjgD (DUF1641 family) n=1 Tax=Brevibacillus fulvus TaxID=1125967 RepID=A0A939BU09_9BACL|nr:DUF1641 domain-containing protein [Brevibacillus fulvus]MBM7589021.1 uncharacterized protein YjgD (DUF1641 family) [Brevibacillus fulvus]
MDTASKQDASVLLEELSNKEVQEAMVTLIQKLPQIKDAVLKVEQGIGTVTSFATDPKNFNSLADTIFSLSNVLNKENLEALLTIIEKLPQIAKMVELLDRVAPFLELVANKDNLVTVAETLETLASPVKDRIQDGVSIVREAKERSAQNTTTVSVFGLLKMLKEPAVQNGLKFTQALLEVLAEKKLVK